MTRWRIDRRSFHFHLCLLPFIFGSEIPNLCCRCTHRNNRQIYSYTRVICGGGDQPCVPSQACKMLPLLLLLLWLGWPNCVRHNWTIFLKKEEKKIKSIHKGLVILSDKRECGTTQKWGQDVFTRANKKLLLFDSVFHSWSVCICPCLKYISMRLT